jgi:putative transposase
MCGVSPRARKRRRLCTSENGAQRLKAERINHVWSYDFVFNQTESGDRLKWLPVLDEFARE